MKVVLCAYGPTAPLKEYEKRTVIHKPLFRENGKTQTVADKRKKKRENFWPHEGQAAKQ